MFDVSSLFFARYKRDRALGWAIPPARQVCYKYWHNWRRDRGVVKAPLTTRRHLKIRIGKAGRFPGTFPNWRELVA